MNQKLEDFYLSKMVSELLVCVIIDVVLFYMIDKWILTIISKCSTSEEKRYIWLMESVGLLVLSFLIYLLHHTPVILVGHSVLTFFSSTTNGYSNLLTYWDVVQNYWREFVDQEESLKELQNNSANHVQQPFYKNQVTPDQYRDYMRHSGDVVINSQNPTSTAHLNQGLKSLRYNEEKAVYEFVAPTSSSQKHSPPNIRSSPPPSRIGQTDIRRRQPLHREKPESPAPPSDIVTQAQPEPQAHAESESVFNNIGSKLLQAVGWSGGNLNMPPGLNNSGRNLCFMNSVLQCLARAPNLADELSEVSKSSPCEDSSRLALIDATAETLQQLNVAPSENTAPIVDTSDFKHAVAEIKPDLLSNEGKYQQQQDACEFFSWLQSELHEIINYWSSNGGQVKGQRTGKVDLDNSLSRLNSIYGNVAETYAKQMKFECHRQISDCRGGMSDPDLVEPIQNLANLEWISHKRSNCSVIDDLFTSQSIELRMCTNCQSISAKATTFNILPLPVPAQTDVITLSDIVASYTLEEKLRGSDQLRCEVCEKDAATPQSLATPMVVRPRQQTDGRRSLVALSPIAGKSDVTRYPAMQSASTPIIGAVTSATVAEPTSSRPVMTDALKQYFLRRLSECMTVQLMRFSFNPFTKDVVKIKTPVSVPLTNLDFSHIVYDDKVQRDDMTQVEKCNGIYNLFGLCVHIGSDSTSSSHYLAYCQAMDGLWYEFDDHRVTKLPSIENTLQTKTVRENCYILFYRRQYNNTSENTAVIP